MTQEKNSRKRLRMKRPKNQPLTPDLTLENQEIEKDVETLLDIPQRKPLPQPPQRKGRRFKLVDIIHHAPDLYARLITHIRAGVSFNVAAAAVGIGERTFYDWGEKGSLDYEAGKDTYFSRFYHDVRKAAATATADCEMAVKELDPKKWLSHGPGRIFGGQWSENISRGPNYDPSKHPQPQIQYVDAPFKVLAPPVDPKSISSPEKPDQTLEIGKDLEYEAFKVLEDIGCITLSDDFKLAFEQQKSEDNDKEREPDGEPDE